MARYDNLQYNFQLFFKGVRTILLDQIIDSKKKTFF